MSFTSLYWENLNPEMLDAAFHPAFSVQGILRDVYAEGYLSYKRHVPRPLESV